VIADALIVAIECAKPVWAHGTGWAMPGTIDIKPLAQAGETAVLALNNAHAVETSPLDAAKLRAMLREAFLAAAIGDLDALLIAFDQDAGYDSPNFLWFRQRFERFVYVDRVITAPAARGKGYARALYERLFAQAARAGHGRIACEVNLVPPNPGSDAFHAALGFREEGRATLNGNGKSVRYLTRGIP
jgi:predicted GNAT superfamily acetyltransferase